LLTIPDRQTDDPLFAFERDDERFGCVVEPGVIKQPSEVEHVLVDMRTPATFR
jgi:hypothetical protein